MSIRHAVSSACFAIALSTAVSAENWPQFRGPDGIGWTDDIKLPTEWGVNKNVAWRVAVPGVAWSQPVVWGDRIFVTTAITENQQKPNVGQPFGGGRGPGSFRPSGPGDRGRGSGERPNLDRARLDRDNDEGSRGDENSPQPRGPREDRPGGGRGGFGRGGGRPPDQVYRWMVLCLDRSTGKVLWEKLAHEGKPTISMHRTNTFASETPVTDGRHLFAYFGMTGLYAYDLDGNLVWTKNLGTYPMMMGWGTGSSPALDGDRLFVQCDNEQDSFLMALDKSSGDELWRVKRDEKSSWSSPFVWKSKTRTELVTAGGGKMRAYDPSDGHVLWELGGFRGRCSATPVGTDELLYLGVGGGGGGSGPLMAIRAGAEGDITLEPGATGNGGVAWIVPRGGPPMASPLVYRDRLYILDQRGGIVGCYNAKTGEQSFRQRIEGAKGFTASPWAHDGKIFCLDEVGQTFVLAAGDKFEVLATNKLDDTFWSSVALAGDRLLLRGVNYLHAIGAGDVEPLGAD